MSVIVFPSSLKVESSTWSQTRLDLAFDSVFGSQGVEVSPPLWDVVISSPEMLEQESGEWQALLMKLRGQTNQLELWNHGRSTPRGTMRGTMTLNIAAAQGDVVLSIIAATEATKTLKAGDLLGIGSASTKQVVMIMADATADGTGVISVDVEPPAAVTWNKPTILFRRKQSQATWDYKNVLASGFSLDLIEDTRT
jgi:hypothetical protein